MSPRPPSVKALTFDVFGTVVDWRASIIREGQLLAGRKGLRVDWGKFADAWRGGYGPMMDRVRRGSLPWTKIDGLHRLILDGLLDQFDIRGLSAAEILDLNRAWHRLLPWPDTVPGLNRLRSRYVLATLSNGNVSLLVDMARNAGLPWDCVLSAEQDGVGAASLGGWTCRERGHDCRRVLRRHGPGFSGSCRGPRRLRHFMGAEQFAK